MRSLIVLVVMIPLLFLVSQAPSSLLRDNQTHGGALGTALANYTAENLIEGADVYDVALDTAGGKMYWTAPVNGKIQRSNLDGTGLEDTILIINGTMSDPEFDAVPVGIDLDLVGGKMYWAARNICVQPCSKVQRANTSGSSSSIKDSVQTLVQAVNLGTGVALDVAQGKVYWAATNDNKIQRANLDGTGVEDVVTGLSGPEFIALDLDNSKVYWTEPGAGKIRRANLDGTEVEDSVTGLTKPTGIALDIALGKVYWTDFTDGTVQRANLNGTSVRDVVTGLVEPTGMALDIVGGKVYWGTFDSKIQRADMPAVSCSL